jgi:hypothetical protein
VVVLTHKEVLARIPSNDIVYSIMLKEPLSLRCAMNKISEISYLNSSTHAYCFMFNLIGEYSMIDNFLVDHICITCDRINKLKLAVFSPICYALQSFCCGTLDYVRNSLMHSGLVEVFQPTKLDMLGCSNLANLPSNWLNSLCLFHNLLPTCATDPYFTYISTLSSMLPVGHNDHAHITEYYCVRSSLVHHNPSSTAESWHEPIFFSHFLDWFDLVHHKFDHRSSLQKLNLILNNKTIYLFVFHHDYDYLYFTYTCNLSCLMYSRYIFHVLYTYTLRTRCSFCSYHFQLTQSRGRLFLKKGRMMRIQSWIMLILSV